MLWVNGVMFLEWGAIVSMKKFTSGGMEQTGDNKNVQLVAN